MRYISPIEYQWYKCYSTGTNRTNGQEECLEIFKAVIMKFILPLEYQWIECHSFGVCLWVLDNPRSQLWDSRITRCVKAGRYKMAVYKIMKYPSHKANQTQTWNTTHASCLGNALSKRVFPCLNRIRCIWLTCFNGEC